MQRRTLLKYAAAGIPLAAMTSKLPAGAKEQGGTLQVSTTMKIQRLAWAGIKIEVEQTTLFVDATSYEQQNDMKLTVETENRHAVITHHHPDHYDPEALKTVFDKRSRLFCHESVLPWVDTRELRTQSVAMYQPVDISRWTGDLVAIPVPAVDGFGHPQVSWVIQGGAKKIIHCGDTLWHGYWRDIAISYGPFDMVFMPINGARLNQGRVRDVGMPAVLTPQQAIIASKLLNGKVVCPIHYGRASENYFETPDPEGNFLKFSKEMNTKTIVMKQGDYVRL